MNGEHSSGATSQSAGLQAVPVAFGEPARRALAQFVATAKATDPLRPVTVVVPSNYTGLALRRAMAAVEHGADWAGGGAPSQTSRLAGIAALETVTLAGLAERVGAASLQAKGRLPLSGLMTTAAVRAALREQPGSFAPVAAHHQTSDAMAATYREVRDLSPGHRRRLATASDRARSVMALYERVRGSLRDQWYDETDLLAEATQLVDALRRWSDDAPSAGMAYGDDLLGVATAVTELGAIALFLPRRLSLGEAGLVRALGSHVRSSAGRRNESRGEHADHAEAGQPPSDVLVLLGVTGDPGADAGARVTCERLGIELPSSLQEGGGRHSAADRSQAAEQRIVSVSDPDEEVRFVVRSVLADLDTGVAPQHVAVFYGPDEPYGRAFEEQFDAAGIRTFGSTSRTLAESMYGRFALGLAALASTAPMAIGAIDTGPAEPRLRRRDVFDLLAGAKVPYRSDRDRVGGQFFVPDSKWERLARTAHVVEGADWSFRLALHRDDLRAKAAAVQASEDPNEAHVKRLLDDAGECDRLQGFIDELRQNLIAGSTRRTWRALSGWIRRLLRRYLGVAGRDSWTADWPDWERSAAERIEGVLDRLGDLGHFESRIGLDDMVRVLEGQLAKPHGRSGTEGAGIYVGPLAGATDVAPARAYIVGLAEGILPARPQPDSLIGVEERSALGGALSRATDTSADQHRNLLAAMAGISQRCTLVLPRGDLRQSSEHVPSRWLAETAAALDSKDGAYFGEGYVSLDRLLAAATDAQVDGISEIPSHLTGVRDAAFPATISEFDAAMLMSAAVRRRLASAGLPPYDDVAFSAGVEMSAERASARFTRFDGNLAKVIDSDDAIAQVVSPTRLETWAGCPRRYLFEQLLGVRVLEEPEQIVRLGTLERGQLMHAAVDRLISELIAHGEAPGPERPASERDRRRLVALGTELADDYEQRGLVGHSLLWARDREALLADLDELLSRDAQRDPATRGDVVGSEFRFGFGGASGPVTVPLPGGDSVQFRGIIDRVERIRRDAGDELVVIDYKTGSPKRFSEAIRGTRSRSADPAGRGQMLQLPVYALAAAQHFGAAGTTAAPPVLHAAYWFITSEPGAWTWLPLPVDEQTLGRFREAVAVIVKGIRGGVFPGYATEGDDRGGYVACRFCNPDSIGTLDVLASWQRKRGDTALADFATLAEPQNEQP